MPLIPTLTKVINKMRKQALFLVVASFLTGCTTVSEINRPDGVKEYLIGCGASTGWDVCYEKANTLCPNGYIDVSKEPGFNRKELTIQCK